MWVARATTITERPAPLSLRTQCGNSVVAGARDEDYALPESPPLPEHGLAQADGPRRRAPSRGASSPPSRTSSSDPKPVSAPRLPVSSSLKGRPSRARCVSTEAAAETASSTSFSWVLSPSLRRSRATVWRLGACRENSLTKSSPVRARLFQWMCRLSSPLRYSLRFANSSPRRPRDPAGAGLHVPAPQGEAPQLVDLRVDDHLRPLPEPPGEAE